jgi:predicted amidohydrolase YtcJ
MNQIIHNCYDSHTHFLATGQVALGLRLDSLKSPKDIQYLDIKPEHYRSNWLTGFGWDQNLWPKKEFPTCTDLDLVFPNEPVFFSRIDGHASWLNSKAISELRSRGFNFKEKTSGVLLEQEHFAALALLPEFSKKQCKNFALESQKIFNQAGFTHIRDLSMNLSTWNQLAEIDQSGELTLCIDSFVSVKNISELDVALKEIVEMKKNSVAFLKVHGIKFFVDGSLGSKTAFISENYLNSNTNGLFIWPEADTYELLRKVWSLGLDVAVHTIGDQAAHQVVQIARKLSGEGFLGRLHLEHVEILRPETVQLMKPLHIICHMQPCHWLSDEKWLSQVLPEPLLKYQFQWELLRKNKITFYFGSDSPIEKPSLLVSLKALELSAQKSVPRLSGDLKKYYSHPDTQWAPSFTEYNQEKLVQVVFNNMSVFKN